MAVYARRVETRGSPSSRFSERPSLKEIRMRGKSNRPEHPEFLVCAHMHRCAHLHIYTVHHTYPHKHQTKFIKDFFVLMLCTCVYLCVGMCMCVQIPEEARSIGSPWSWLSSTQQGCCFWKTRIHPQLLSCLPSPITEF